ncbi:MAG: ribonuclease Y [Verrucomicrobia bacterium GWF2_51_19]|nr:MAG: ribonuclease Y [Verrucomicrobia bacterium GWF2_51_19]
MHERRWLCKENALKIKECEKEHQLFCEKKKMEWEGKLQELSLEQTVKARENALFTEKLKQQKLQQDHTQRIVAHRDALLLEKEQTLHETLAQYKAKLQETAKLSEADILNELRVVVERECEEDLKDLRQRLLSKSEQDVRYEARKILVDAIQRLMSSPLVDASATVVKIPNEEMKGRLIGREGRNIKTFEMTTGTTLMIDETPGSVLVSSFDPIRREVARIALERLVQDGRIQPTSIEEQVERAKVDMQQTIRDRGEDALARLNITNTHKDIAQYLGKLYYRYSYHQNTLEHSLEVAHCCALLAAEIGINSEIAKRCGLFHDIGKALDENYDGSHAQAGATLLKQLGESDIVVHAVAAHHEEERPETLYAQLVLIADTVSASRPGARSETLDGYLQRIHSLEDIVKSFDGIKEAFAIQGGKEVRVLVEPKTVDDDKALSLTRKIRAAIEEQLDYPGSIKITLIREQRFTDSAK